MPSPKNTHGPVVKSGPTAGNVRTRNSTFGDTEKIKKG